MRDRRRARWAAALARGEEGSVLVMVPAGLLVMILLGAMAVDLSLAFAGERRVADLAASIADVAVAQVSDASFYGTTSSEVVLDPERIDAAVAAAWADIDDPALLDVQVSATIVPGQPRTVAVTVTADVPYLFLDAVPGMGSRRVDATSVATLVLGN